MTGAPYERETIFGLVLAGGRSRRMDGRNKANLLLDGQPLIVHVAERLRPLVTAIAVSANENPAQVPAGVTAIIPDETAQFPGPAAGILAGMNWIAAHRPATRWLLTAPTDCPDLPPDLGVRLWDIAHGEEKRLALAASGGRVHYVCGLWRMDLRETIAREVLENGETRMYVLAEICGYAAASWDMQPADPFINVNTPEDLRQVQIQHQIVSDRHSR